MSKYMQIDIRIVPFLDKRFDKLFPNTTMLFKQLSYDELVEKDLSFYRLVDHMVAIAESPNTPSHVKDNLKPFVGKMKQLKESAREHLLARRLNELDQVLYQIEDEFEDLERAL